MWLDYEIKGLLIGESANARVVKDIRQIAAGQKEIQQINEVLTFHMGLDVVLVNISAKFTDDLLAEEVESAVETLDAAIKVALPCVKRVSIEGERKKRATESAAADRR